MSNEFNIEDIFIKSDLEIESKKDLFKPRELLLSECSSNVDFGLSEGMWEDIIFNISEGVITGHQDLQSMYGLDVFKAMAIYESSLMEKIHKVKTSEAKSKLLIGAVNRLEEIYQDSSLMNRSDAISAIDKLAKIVGVTTPKSDVSVNNNINVNIESVLRAVKKDKGVIDI